MRLDVLALAFVCSGCDYAVLSTQVGEHVVYHWDADARAAENQQLCGGTVKAADRFVAGVSAHYGWTLPQDGPTTEYFWDRALMKSMCPSYSRGCVTHKGTVFTYHPFHTHELAHTAKGGHGHSPFINEGFATRWASGLVSAGITPVTTPDFFNEDQLRAQLDMDDASSVDYPSAFTWWVALETTYGPAKMTDFIIELDNGPVSTRHVEHALQRVFGISLAESAALAEDLPELELEDPACEFDGLPTLVWHEDDPFIIEREGASCEDSDIVSVQGRRASWLVALEFPNQPVELDLYVTAPEDSRTQKALLMAECDITMNLDYPSYDTLSAWALDAPARSRHLSGRYVASLVGVIAADGAVEFPRVVFEAPQPQP